jgi:hypothetical protein
MRIPFKTEMDAFRVAAVLGLLLGVSILVGALSSLPYGVVVFAAGCAAGLVFELSGRETVASGLRDAASASHLHGTGPGERDVLVIAAKGVVGELRRQLQPGRVELELDVFRRLWRHDCTTGRGCRSRAERRTCGSRHRSPGLSSKGSSPKARLVTRCDGCDRGQARDFGVDEVVIVTHPRAHDWLANRMFSHLKKQLEVPVREIVMGDERDGSSPPSTEPAG